MQLDSSSTALVTGANGGIGQAIARALAATGAQVIVSGRRADALAGVAAETKARVIVAAPRGSLRPREHPAMRQIVQKSGTFGAKWWCRTSIRYRIAHAARPNVTRRDRRARPLSERTVAIRSERQNGCIVAAQAS